MRQLRQMLRLHHDGLGAREIGRRLGVARSTIQDNLKRAQMAELFWPLPPDLSEERNWSGGYSAMVDPSVRAGAASSRTVRRWLASSNARASI